MKSSKKDFNGLVKSSRFIFDLNFREAVIVSVGLHVGIAIAATTILLDTPRLIGPQIDQLNLELEMIAEEEPVPQPLYDYSNQTESAGTEQNDAENGGMSSPEAGGDPLGQKQALLLAALNTMSALKESFNFVTHEVMTDSSGAFIPIQGLAPDIQGLADGLHTAIQMGIRTGRIGIGGGGNCPGDKGVAK